MKNNIICKNIFGYWLSSIKQCFAYGAIFIVYIYIFFSIFTLLKPLQMTEAIGSTLQIIIPIILSLGYCFFKLRKNFHFRIKNIVTLNSILRLLVRFLAVFCFLFLGYLMEKKVVLPDFGEVLNILRTMVTNFGIYMIVAVLPTAFAIIEYVFVPYPNNQSA